MTATDLSTLKPSTLGSYLLRFADDNLVLGQRLASYITRAPELEEDIAVANISLDLIGLATHLYTYAATLLDDDTSADDLAMLRSEREYRNLLLVEQPHAGFNDVMVRQLFFDAYQLPLLAELAKSDDTTIAGIAQRAEREATYHLRHSSSWVIRLGDGTSESHARMQHSVDSMWRFTGELFVADALDLSMAENGVGVDPRTLEHGWNQRVGEVLHAATLSIPTDAFQATGGRTGLHSEHLGPMLSEMQTLARSFPGASW